MSPFQKWEQKNRTLINEIIVPIGLVFTLTISLWIAGQ